MNVWYTAGMAGLFLFIEALVNLFLNLAQKRQRETSIARAISAFAIILLAILSIRFHWNGAGIVVPYSPAYAFAAAAFVLFLDGSFSWIAAHFTHPQSHAEVSLNIVYIGGVGFILGTILVFITNA